MLANPIVLLLVVLLLMWLFFGGGFAGDLSQVLGFIVILMVIYFVFVFLTTGTVRMF